MSWSSKTMSCNHSVSHSLSCLFLHSFEIWHVVLHFTHSDSSLADVQMMLLLMYEFFEVMWSGSSLRFDSEGERCCTLAAESYLSFRDSLAASMTEQNLETEVCWLTHSDWCAETEEVNILELTDQNMLRLELYEVIRDSSWWADIFCSASNL